MRPKIFALYAILLTGLAIFQTFLSVFAGYSHFQWAHWLDLIGFFLIPAFLWILLLPYIYKHMHKLWKNIEDYDKLIPHLILLAVIIVPIHRIVAAMVDLGIRAVQDKLSTGFLTALVDAGPVIISTLPEYFILFFFLSVSMLILFSKQTEQRQKASQKISIKHAEGYDWVMPDHIEYVEAQGNYVLIKTGEKLLKSRLSMKEAEQKFQPCGFKRIHRSVIINPSYIGSVRHWQKGNYWIIMQSQKIFTSSTSFKENLKWAIR